DAVADDRANVDQLRTLDRLVIGEAEESADYVVDSAHVAADARQLAPVRSLPLEEIEPHLQTGERVLDLVRKAAGEDAQRCDALRLRQFLASAAQHEIRPRAREGIRDSMAHDAMQAVRGGVEVAAVEAPPDAQRTQYRIFGIAHRDQDLVAFGALMLVTHRRG